MPFLEYPPSARQNAPLDEADWSLASHTGQVTFSRCKYAYTRLLYDDNGRLDGKINREEQLLINATEDVLSSICAATVGIGLEIEYTWLSKFDNRGDHTSRTLPAIHLERKVEQRRELLEILQAWLGWASDEIRCEKSCAIDEYCLIPMWPLVPPPSENDRLPICPYPPHQPHQGPPPGNNDTRPSVHFLPGDFEKYLWRPQCIKINA
jgi:hypothetical protein